jgi:exosortase family protein XrtF
MFKNPFLKFLLVFSILIILWFGFYENIYELGELFDIEFQRNISIHVAKISMFFISLFGYTPIIDTSTDFVIISIEGNYLNHGAWIGEPCNGLKVFGLFSIFIIAFQGKWTNKIWFIPLGILILHLANAIRIAILTIISAQNPALLDFNHNITFQVIVYGIVFILWYLWVNKLSKR